MSATVRVNHASPDSWRSQIIDVAATHIVVTHGVSGLWFIDEEKSYRPKFKPDTVTVGTKPVRGLLSTLAALNTGES